ncbi:hypothetical protein Tco_0175828 [Tanacetum coccineum]
MINQQPMLLNQAEDITSLQGIRNVSPNGVFSNEVYGSNSEGFGVNPLNYGLQMVVELWKFVAMMVVVVIWWYATD